LKAVFVNALVVILTFGLASKAAGKYYFSTFGSLVKNSNFPYARF
jgi:hypothetical protein